VNPVPNPAPNSVSVRGLVLQRPGFRLGPLDFELGANGRLAVVGPSGSGKTTLLRCLAGLEPRSTGTVAVGGDEFPAADSRPLHRRGFGLVFQDGALWPHMTALDHLRFAAPGMDRAAAMALLEHGGLGHLAGRKPAAMSGGEAQRLGLLRTLASDPRVMLLDEPLRSVDVHQRYALVLLLRALADERGLTTILVTHDRSEALALATDLLVLRDGRIVERGTATELLVAPRTAFTAAFLGGATCLPVRCGRNGQVDTALGPVPRPPACRPGDEDRLRLVLLPGDVEARAAAAETGVALGQVLAIEPDPAGLRVRVAFDGQIVSARAPQPVPVGASVSLVPVRTPRLLPWVEDPVDTGSGGTG